MSKSDGNFRLQQLLQKSISTGSIYAYVYVCYNLQQQQRNYQLRLHCPTLANESIVDNSQFTLFLTNDNSFLTPWNWKLNDQSDGEFNNGEKKAMVLQHGSFFDYNVNSYSFQRKLFIFLMRGRSNSAQ
uniref:Uncharacterized protein n=1 Tax=Manihot esculenta TaxID=3983 RepID=A0A2C9VEH5_MANES